MKDVLRSLLGARPSRAVVREYLQARILEGLQRCGAMIPLAFQGGTALRFLHGLPRHSEDLDFALERAPQEYALRAWLQRIVTGLTAEGYDLDVRISDRRAVHSAFIRFRGLLQELAVPAQRAEVLAVKVEVDTCPPAGARLETTLVRRHVLLQLQHHDRASLFAGKLHAVLSRPYAKGRDLYDLLWYLSAPGWPEPNLTLLNSALAQTRPAPRRLEAGSWRQAVAARLEELDWRRVADDVRPFLEQPEAVDLLTRDNLLRVLRPERR